MKVLKLFHSKKKLFLYLYSQVALLLLALVHERLLIWYGDSKVGEGFTSFQEKVTLVVFVAPIIETLVFNFLLNELLFRFLKNEKTIILLSSLIFGVAHFYNPLYVVFAFLGGLIFNAVYFKWLGGRKRAILIVFLLHFIHNCLGLFLGK